MSSASLRLQNIQNLMAQSSAPAASKSFSRLIRFISNDGNIYFADLGADDIGGPRLGATVLAYETFEKLLSGSGGRQLGIQKLLAPLPTTGLPIYCVGASHRGHVKEANMSVPNHPVLWVKPEAALANPDEDIPLNKFCASSMPDYEGELAFVTSRTCLNLSVDEAANYVLGYTIGNDLSCRKFQLPENGGGQFFFAKGFDKFSPVGPVLVSREILEKQGPVRLQTRLNGQVMQDADAFKDFIWSAAEILSHMSQGTTIPAGTVVLTGTPDGVGCFQNPPRFLKDGDVVEVEITGVGTLRNKIIVEQI